MIHIQIFQRFNYNPFRPELAIAVDCCHNSRLVGLVDKNNLEVGDKWKNILLLLKQFHENFSSKTTRCRKMSHSSEMQNDASWGLKGLITGQQFIIRTLDALKQSINN